MRVFPTNVEQTCGNDKMRHGSLFQNAIILLRLATLKLRVRSARLLFLRVREPDSLCVLRSRVWLAGRHMIVWTYSTCRCACSQDVFLLATIQLQGSNDVVNVAKWCICTDAPHVGCCARSSARLFACCTRRRLRGTRLFHLVLPMACSRCVFVHSICERLWST